MRDGIRWTVILSFLAGVTILHADEGAYEINQACAVNGGCFAGDNPGFPVQIENTGSYVLTSNLDVTVDDDPPNAIAIAVNTEQVTIDLGGVAIQGPATCSGLPVTSCSNAATESFDAGTGIDGRFWTAIRNGTITGMGADGIFVADGSRVVDVTLQSNAETGLNGTEGILVDRVVSERNGRDGVDVNSNSVLRGVRADGNGQDGIVADTGSTVRNSTASGNGRLGLFVADGSVAKGVTAQNTASAGLLMYEAAVIDSAFFGNDGFGIECDSNVATVRGNTLANNNGGVSQVESTCTLVADNVCNGGAC